MSLVHRVEAAQGCLRIVAVELSDLLHFDLERLPVHLLCSLSSDSLNSGVLTIKEVRAHKEVAALELLFLSERHLEDEGIVSREERITSSSASSCLVASGIDLVRHKSSEFS